MEIVLIIIAIVGIILLFMNRNFKKVVKLFKNESCQVFGVRGSGKDMLMSNVVAYRKEPYVSNVPYTKDKTLWQPFDVNLMQVGGNSYRNFIYGNFYKYEYPLKDGTDIYISDAGVLFPAQYNDKLDKEFPSVPVFQALLRHIGDANFHTNAQVCSRVWIKIREQGERYVYCMSCKVLFGKFVFQRIRIYDKYDSAESKIPPLRLKSPLFGKKVKTDINIAKSKYEANYGQIKSMTLFYIKKSVYDSRRFKKVLEIGEYYD